MNRLWAWALRESLREGYTFKKFIADLKAGVAVGIVAIPLAMALAIASGVAPQNGLYTVIVAGTIAAIFSGSRYQITGPTAAFVVLLGPIVAKFGLSGLLMAGFLAGLILIALGLMRLADVIQYIPHPVTTGFTTGVAIVIGVLQLKDFLGLQITPGAAHFHDRVAGLIQALPSFRGLEIAIGILTLTLLWLSARKIKSLPAPVVALVVITILSSLYETLLGRSDVSTIGNSFTFFNSAGGVELGIPTGWPSFVLPWQVSTPQMAAYDLTWSHVVEIFPYAFSVAMLAAIETLLSAVVADGATREKHNPNAELIAQGLGNAITPFFGGMPATGAVSRTMTNVRFGAVTPIAALIHVGVVVLTLLVFAPLINRVPMAALAATLIYVAYHMAEKRHFRNILRDAPRDDKMVLLACFFFTVFTDMTIGVAVGVGLAALLFIRRVANLSHSQVFATNQPNPEINVPVPSGTFVYRVRGSLFFGAAHRALSALNTTSSPQVNRVVIDLTDVLLMDATGAVAFNSALEQFIHRVPRITLICTEPAIVALIKSIDICKRNPTRVEFRASLAEALKS